MNLSDPELEKNLKGILTTSGKDIVELENTIRDVLKNKQQELNLEIQKLQNPKGNLAKIEAKLDTLSYGGEYKFLSTNCACATRKMLLNTFQDDIFKKNWGIPSPHETKSLMKEFAQIFLDL